MYPLYKPRQQTMCWIFNMLLFILYSDFLFHKSFAQSTETSDKLDFTQSPDLKNSPSCVYYCLVTCIPVPGAPKQPDSTAACRRAFDPSMGCTTSKCLCSDIERVEGALKRIHSCAFSECGTSSYGDDSAAGQKLLLDYCTMKGYQFVGNPTSTSATATTLSGSTEPGLTVTVSVSTTATAVSGAREGISMDHVCGWRYLRLVMLMPMILIFA